MYRLRCRFAADPGEVLDGPEEVAADEAPEEDDEDDEDHLVDLQRYDVL